MNSSTSMLPDKGAGALTVISRISFRAHKQGAKGRLSSLRNSSSPTLTERRMKHDGNDKGRHRHVTRPQPQKNARRPVHGGHAPGLRRHPRVPRTGGAAAKLPPEGAPPPPPTASPAPRANRPL